MATKDPCSQSQIVGTYGFVVVVVVLGAVSSLLLNRGYYIVCYIVFSLFSPNKCEWPCNNSFKWTGRQCPSSSNWNHMLCILPSSLQVLMESAIGYVRLCFSMTNLHITIHQVFFLLISCGKIQLFHTKLNVLAGWQLFFCTWLLLHNSKVSCNIDR